VEGSGRGLVALPWNLPRRTQTNHELSQPELSVSELRFKPDTSGACQTSNRLRQRARGRGDVCGICGGRSGTRTGSSWNTPVLPFYLSFARSAIRSCSIGRIWRLSVKELGLASFIQQNYESYKEKSFIYWFIHQWLYSPLLSPGPGPGVFTAPLPSIGHGADHIENTYSVVRLLWNLAITCSMAHREHSSYCCMYTESLPNNGHIRHNMSTCRPVDVQQPMQ
jgi:hypothetical protein